MAELTTIPIRKETRDALKKQGFKDETYDEIIRRLIELSKRQFFYERQKKILETEEFVPIEEV